MLLPAVPGCEGCPSWVPRTGVARLREEPTTGCRLQDRQIQRATNDRAASTQPALAELPTGHVLAWIDDRSGAPEVLLQLVDPAGRPRGAVRTLPVDGRPFRPRLAASGEEIAVAYGAIGPDGSGRAELQLLDHDLGPARAEPTVLGATDASHGTGLTRADDHYLAGSSVGSELVLTTIRVERRPGAPRGDGGGEALDGAPAASAPEAVTIDLARRTVAVPDDMPPPGNVDLMVRGGRLFLTTDTPEGWSIQLLEVGDDGMRLLAQVVDDRRNPDLHWCCPVLAPVRDEGVALLWQGPSPGLTSLHFLGFEADGTPIGRVQLFEAIVRDEDGEGPAGRAPAFDPAIAPSPSGLLVAFADNRFANSEILLAPLTCTE